MSFGDMTSKLTSTLVGFEAELAGEGRCNHVGLCLCLCLECCPLSLLTDGLPPFGYSGQWVIFGRFHLVPSDLLNFVR